MAAKVIFFIGSILPILWGASHLFPTRAVVRGFGDISKDNRLIITMEWIIEGVTLIFIGCIGLVVTLFGDASRIGKLIYIVLIVMLNVMSVVSLFTGFRVKMIPFKLCPFIFTGSSLLMLIGIII
jgi:hypothetical protein